MATSNAAASDRATTTTLLRRGYAVLVPDYGTVGGVVSPQYTDPAGLARSAADAMAAARTVDPQLSDRWAAVGDVQGAAAAVELAHSASTWRKDLDFRGATAGSVPAGMGDLVAGLGPNSPAVPAPVVADVVYTLAATGDAALDGLLSDRGRALVKRAQGACAPELRRAVRGVPLSRLLSKPMSSAPKFAASLRKSLTPPTNGFTRPLLLSQPLTDESVELAATARFVADAQLASNKVQAASYPTLDDADAQRQERTRVLQFLREVF